MRFGRASLGIATGLASTELPQILSWIGPEMLLLLVAALAAFCWHSSDLEVSDLADDGQKGQLPTLCFAAWVLWAAATASLASQPGLSLSAAVAFGATGLAALAVAKTSGWRGVGEVLLWALAAHSLLAILVAMRVGQDFYSGRLTLLALESNQLARALVLVCLVGMMFFGLRSTTRWRVATAIVLLIVVSALLATEGRMAVLALGFGVACLAAGARSSWLRGGAWLAAFTSVALALVLVTGVGASLISRSGDTAELSSMNGRRELWPLIVDDVREHPIVGVGLAADRTVVEQKWSDGELGWSASHSHNLVLHLGLSTGIPGAAMFLVGVLATLLAAIKAHSSAGVAVVGGLLLMGITEAVFLAPSFAWVALVGATVARTDTALSPSGMVRAPCLWPAPVAAMVSAGAMLAAASILFTLQPFGLPHRAVCQTYSTLGQSPMISLPEPAVLESPSVRSLDSDTAALMRCAGLRAEGFTVELVIQPANTTQDGPARLLTVSDGPAWIDGDFMVGQAGSSAEVRVRSNLRIRTELVVADVFDDDDSRPTHLVLVVTSDEVLVYVDGELRSQSTLPAVDFATWRSNFPVNLGNEVTLDRPWLGTISRLRIFPGPLEAGAVLRLRAE